MPAQARTIQGGFNAARAYQDSFGNLPHETLYDNSFGLNYGAKSYSLVPELNERLEIGMKTTMSTYGGAGTAGYAMIPVYVDPVVIDSTRKWTPFYALVPKVTNMGMTADYNNVTAKNMAFSAAENASLAVKDSTTDRYSTAIKFVYATGGVTGQSQAAQPSYMLQGFEPGSGYQSQFANVGAPSSKQFQVTLATRALVQMLENMLINGNSTTSGISGNPNGTEFDGVVSLMGATNTVDKNTSDLQLKDLDTAMQYAYDDGGLPNLAVCSTAVWTDLRQLILAKFGYMQSLDEVFWGYKTIVLKTIAGDVPVVPSQYLSNTSGSKAIYFLDMSVVEMRVLQDITYFDLARTRDAEEFALKWYGALIIRNTSFCASVTEIK